MDVRGPMAVFFCWEALVLAVAVNALTMVAKRAVELAIGGRDARKRNHPWLSGLVLPALPLLLGAVGAFPLHPEVVTRYVEAARAKHLLGHPWLITAIWGIAIGQLADYLYQRVRQAIELRSDATAEAREDARGKG